MYFKEKGYTIKLKDIDLVQWPSQHPYIHGNMETGSIVTFVIGSQVRNAS